MSRRLHLPPIERPVEPPGEVRERAGRRIRLVGALLLLTMVLTGARGVQLSLFPSDRTLRVAAVQRWDQVTVQARRGEILDREGRRLATSVATPNIVVDPLLVEPDEVDELARRVAAILEIPAGEVAAKMRRNSRYARLAVRVHPGVAARIEGLGHRALWAERSARRYYPEEALGAQVLGFVDASGAGRAGLEASLDSSLRGGNLLLQRRRDRRGLTIDDPRRDAAELNAGMDVHTTLDRTIQRITERALEGVLARSAPEAASAVVVDVRTGDILAMATLPAFNPNAVGQDAAPQRNRVVQDAIEPGSVFKPFSVAAAVEEGLVTEHSSVDCEGGAYYIGRTRIRDDHPRRVISLSEVVKYSSNIGTAKLALRLGADTFLDYVRAFGFGERTGIPLPGERKGVIRSPERIKPIELATTSYGQGMTSTPLQLAMATAALANGGVRMKPRLVTRIEDAHGVPEFVQKPTVAAQVVSPETAESLARMMVTVTEPGGTGTRARVPGYRVAGKTGTAEKVKDGRYSPTARIGSFVGFVPADDPVLAIVVSVDEPTRGSRYGGIVAAPVFAEIAGLALRHLGVAPDPELLEEPRASGQVAHKGPAPVEENEPIPSGGVRLTWNGDAWTLPDLRGLPMRDVLVGLQGSGISVDVEGSGLVVSQNPPPGAPVAPGGTLAVALQ